MDSSNLNITQAGQLALQTGGLAGWADLKVGLGTDVPVSPGYSAVYGDFGAASFTGYASESVTLTGGHVDQSSHSAYALSPLAVFNGPSSGPGTDVRSAFFFDGSDSTVYGWTGFNGPLPLQLATDCVALVLQLTDANEGTVFTVP